MTDKFEVFISHNSKDKSTVRDLVQRLEELGINVWFDEDQLIPGRNWQQLLAEGIENSTTGAVLVGKDGSGPWQNQEMQALLEEAVSTGMPVIPVILPDAPEKPKLPLFLKTRGWVDLRPAFTKEGIDKLFWAITAVIPGTEGIKVKWVPTRDPLTQLARLGNKVLRPHDSGPAGHYMVYINGKKQDKELEKVGASESFSLDPGDYKFQIKQNRLEVAQGMLESEEKIIPVSANEFAIVEAWTSLSEERIKFERQ